MTSSPPTITESERVAALRALQVLDTPAEERFDRITRLAARLFGVPMAAVTLVDEDRTWLKSKVGELDLQVDRAQSFCDTTIAQPDSLVVPDLRDDERFRLNPLVAGPEGLRFYAGHPLEAPGGHRVGSLCLFDARPRDLDAADRDLLRELAAWVEKELALDEELERAAEVQRGLLPRSVPDLTGWDVAGSCRPARSVGGDLLDWYDAGPGLVVTLADVMGKGMPAAIVAATVRAVLRSATRHAGLLPAVLQTDSTVAADFGRQQTFVTLFHALIDPGTGALQAVDAGHGLAWVVRANGALERLPRSGTPLGVLPDATWEPVTTELRTGDALVVVSDGVLDLVDGLDGVEERVRSAVRTGTARTAVEALLACDAGQEEDDLTACVVRRTA